MFNIEQLNKVGIDQWDSIKKDYYNPSILLGNGFSINFSDSLRYKNLYDFFIKKCTEVSKKLFISFDTKNFEEVLGNLEIANNVCKSFNIELNEFNKYITEIKLGLIDSIDKIHPTPIHVNYDLVKKIAEEISIFDQIFTTNYDLFLYYIILESKKYGDHFFNHYSDEYNCFGNPDKMKYNHIYFLHGALFLFQNGMTTLKIKRPKEGWLLNIITEKININDYPLFISEGKSELKHKAIQSNPYLLFCLKKFSENTSSKKLIVYGQSLSKQDEHIVKIIEKVYKDIAISIRPNDWNTIEEIETERKRIRLLFPSSKIQFFDSRSLFSFNK